MGLLKKQKNAPWKKERGGDDVAVMRPVEPYRMSSEVSVSALIQSHEDRWEHLRCSSLLRDTIWLLLQ